MLVALIQGSNANVKCSYKSPYNEITMENIILAFAILGVGVIVSALTLLYECFRWKL